MHKKHFKHKSEHLITVKQVLGITSDTSTLTEADINKAFEKNSLKINDEPDSTAKNLKHQALTEAKEHCLFIISKQPDNIPFPHMFSWFNRSGVMKPWPEIQALLAADIPFTKLLYQLGQLRNHPSSKSRQECIAKLKELLEEKPELLTFEPREEFDFHGLFLFSTVLGAAAASNDVEFFKWLLEKNVDPLQLNGQGLNALETALRYGHTNIVDALEEVKGKTYFYSKLQQLLNKSTQLEERYPFTDDVFRYLKTKKLLSPETIATIIEKNPYRIFLFTKLGYLTKEQSYALLKKKIIGTPGLYAYMDKELQNDPYMVVATVAQTKSLSSDYLKRLPDYFSYMLIHIWPELEKNISEKKDGHYYSQFQMTKSKNIVLLLALNAIIDTVFILTYSALVFDIAVAIGIVLSIVLAISIAYSLYGIYLNIRGRSVRTEIDSLLENNGFFIPKKDDNAKSVYEEIQLDVGASLH